MYSLLLHDFKSLYSSIQYLRCSSYEVDLPHSLRNYPNQTPRAKSTPYYQTYNNMRREGVRQMLLVPLLRILWSLLSDCLSSRKQGFIKSLNSRHVMVLTFTLTGFSHDRCR